MYEIAKEISEAFADEYKLRHDTPERASRAATRDALIALHRLARAGVIRRTWEWKIIAKNKWQRVRYYCLKAV